MQFLLSLSLCPVKTLAQSNGSPWFPCGKQCFRFGIRGLVRFIIMAGAGMGISILPSNVANEHLKDLIFRDITDFHPLIELVAVWNKRRINPGTLEFIELLFDDLNSAEKNPSL